MRSWTPGRHGWGVLAAVAAVYLAIAWPGAGERGVIAEEVTPYLHRYPRVLARADASGVELLPPHDLGTSPGPGWVRTSQWPNLAYRGETRDWPVLIRGYQSALGSYVGVLAQPLLGGGIAGVRRSSALLGLGLLALVFALGRRLGLRPGLAGAAALLCGLSPGLMFFARTGYGFELASRVCMLAALVLVARPRAPTRGQGLAAGLCVAAAIACRATIAATLVPATNANTNIAVNTNVNPTSSLPMASSSSNGNSMTPAPASDSSGWLLWVLGGVIVAALAGIGVVAATRGSSARR